MACRLEGSGPHRFVQLFQWELTEVNALLPLLPPSLSPFWSQGMHTLYLLLLTAALLAFWGKHGPPASPMAVT